MKLALSGHAYFFAFILANLSSCVASQKSKSDKKVTQFWTHLELKAWNEDPVNKVLFGMDKSDKFYYTIIENALNKKTVRYYSGTWLKSSDTLYLAYNKNIKPARFKSFLIIESGGHYLFQHLDTAMPRIYLQILDVPYIHSANRRPKPWEHY